MIAFKSHFLPRSGHWNDGEQIIAEFVSSCKALKDIHSDTELNIRLKELRCQVKASSNLYVRALLASLPS
uniref:Uncharacterized protein n=1 Tax=Timema douglasi TaxID=61478 RepID=A0A7R8VLH7_TIMDO|nr:unnamed protein product [Timema douglasi]